MKLKQRTMALLLSVVMVLVFMPALAFADDAPAEPVQSFRLSASSWDASPSNDRLNLDKDGNATLAVELEGNVSGPKYEWYFNNEDEPFETGSSRITVHKAGPYHCIVSQGDDERYVWFNVDPFTKGWSAYNSSDYSVVPGYKTAIEPEVTVRLYYYEEVGLDPPTFTYDWQYKAWGADPVPLDSHDRVLMADKPGDYLCTVTDNYGNSLTPWITVTENSLDSGWTAFTENKNVELVNGKATLKVQVCFADGVNPDDYHISYKWELYDYEDPVVYDVNEPQFEVKQAGEYNCIVSNGSSEKTVTFFVYGNSVPDETYSFVNPEFRGIKDMIYTGQPQKQSLQIVVDDPYENYKQRWVLDEGYHYKLVYKNNVNVGKATVEVVGLNQFNGCSISATFNINPKDTTLSKPKAGKKSVTVKWKKQAAQTSGYEIQYGLKKNFKGAKIKTIKKNSTLKATIKKLKSKKTYYIRIRTYKTIGSSKYYSAWSAYKKIKVK